MRDWAIERMRFIKKKYIRPTLHKKSELLLLLCCCCYNGKNKAVLVGMTDPTNHQMPEKGQLNHRARERERERAKGREGERQGQRLTWKTHVDERCPLNLCIMTTWEKRKRRKKTNTTKTRRKNKKKTNNKNNNNNVHTHEM